MTNLSVIENKISAAQKHLKILERYKKYSEKEIEEDLDIRGAFERYLSLAIQSTIDLAEAVISYKNFRKPSTMSVHVDSASGLNPPFSSYRRTVYCDGFYRDVKRGISLGCPLSPLMGALYLRSCPKITWPFYIPFSDQLRSIFIR